MTSDAGHWETAIAEVLDDDVIIRGYPLTELVGSIGFADAVFLVITGDLPSEQARKMLEAIWVCGLEHGISPSSMITRMLTSCGTPIQAALAGGVVSVADWHGGSGEQLGAVLQRLADTLADTPDADRPRLLQTEVRAVVQEYVRAGKRFEGFGHPQHGGGDPRAKILLRLGDELQVSGQYVDLLRELTRQVQAELVRPLEPNVTGVIAALLLDVGFPVEAIRGLGITARIPGLTAHVVEELQQGGRWRHATASQVRYTGEPLRHMERAD